MRLWLYKLRGEASQKEIARRCGISQQTYSFYETGRRTPRPSLARRIAQELGCDWTLFYRDEPSV